MTANRISTIIPPKALRIKMASFFIGRYLLVRDALMYLLSPTEPDPRMNLPSITLRKHVCFIERRFQQVEFLQNGGIGNIPEPLFRELSLTSRENDT
jgi:hypothetical protein